jgi:hypothetical protein
VGPVYLVAFLRRPSVPVGRFGSPFIIRKGPKSVLTATEHSRPCRSPPRRSKTSWMNWKRQSRADCVPGSSSSGYEPSSRIWAKPRFRHRPRRLSMQREKSWNTPSRNLSGFGTRRLKSLLFSATVSRCDPERGSEGRLPASSPGSVESSGSGGGFDSQLMQCAGDMRTRSA